MPDPTPPTLDLESTLKRLKDDKEFLHMLLQVFLDDLPKKLGDLDRAFETANIDTVLRAAHSLKGACATIGAEALRQAALELEMAARNADMQAARAAYAPLVPMAGELVVRLKTELA